MNKMPTQNNRIDILNIQIINGDKVIYEGEGTSLSSRNEKGRFDILPLQTNYISLIKDFILVNPTDGKQDQVVIKTGIMRVYDNTVQIFLGFES